LVFVPSVFALLHANDKRPNSEQRHESSLEPVHA